MATLLAILPQFATIVLPVVLISVLILSFSKLRMKHMRRPFTQSCLREPGYHLRRRLEEADENFFGCIALIMGGPLYFFTAHAIGSYFTTPDEEMVRVLFSIIIPLLLVLFIMIKLMELSRRRHHLRIKLDGEIVSSQLLDPLKRQGFHIYHDLHAGGFHIGHILIGPSGVFTVKTKACSKAPLGRNSSDPEVLCGATELSFPRYRDSRAIREAKEQAVWLKRWLADATGESTHVHPLLIIPGWQIKLQNRSDEITIINGSDLEFISNMESWKPLSNVQIEQISWKLEQQCATPCLKL